MMPLKNPDLKQISVVVPIQIYEWMEERILEGRYATKSEIMRQALFELKNRKETTITSFRVKNSQFPFKHKDVLKVEVDPDRKALILTVASEEKTVEGGTG